MINGVGSYPIIGTFHPEVFLGDGRFAPNAGSNPVAATLGGSLVGLYTVTYAATGLYTVTLASNFKFPVAPVITVSSTCADLTDTNRFGVVCVGDYDSTNHRFVIGAVQKDVAFQVPADANNWISFAIAIRSSTAKR